MHGWFIDNNEQINLDNPIQHKKLTQMLIWTKYDKLFHRIILPNILTIGGQMPVVWEVFPHESIFAITSLLISMHY